MSASRALLRSSLVMTSARAFSPRRIRSASCSIAAATSLAPVLASRKRTACRALVDRCAPAGARVLLEDAQRAQREQAVAAVALQIGQGLFAHDAVAVPQGADDVETFFDGHVQRLQQRLKARVPRAWIPVLQQAARGLRVAMAVLPQRRRDLSARGIELSAPQPGRRGPRDGEIERVLERFARGRRRDVACPRRRPRRLRRAGPRQ
jgi:hypothetical protein